MPANGSPTGADRPEGFPIISTTFPMTRRFLVRVGCVTVVAFTQFLLSGCAVSPSASTARSAPVRQAGLPQSTGQSAVPLAFNLTDRRQTAYAANLVVSEWRSVDERGAAAPNKAIDGGVPYVVFVYAKPQGRAYEITRLSEVSAIRWAGSETAGVGTVTAAGQTFSNVKGASLVLCPATLEAPKRADCVVAAGGRFEVQWAKGDGYVRKVPMSDGSRQAGFSLWDLLAACMAPGGFEDMYGRVPMMACPTGESAVALTHSDPEAIVKTMAERARQWREAKQADEARKAADDKRRREEAQRRVREKLAGAQRGSVMFCESLGLLSPGNSVSDLSFRCDLAGRDHFFGVRELMGWGWNIESEMRTPEVNMAGSISHSVSLRLCKG